MKLETVSVSSTAPVVALVIWICSSRARLSQLSAYRVTSCDLPSVRSTLMLKLVDAYQVAAIRPEPPGFSRALGSVVLEVQTVVDSPIGVTVA